MINTKDALSKMLGKPYKDNYSKNNEAKHYPKPKYNKCNKGHTLVEVYDENKNAYIWDCPYCKEKMERGRGK